MCQCCCVVVFFFRRCCFVIGVVVVFVWCRCFVGVVFLLAFFLFC